MGYFESRWSSTQWACSLATIHEQAAEWKLNPHIGLVRLTSPAHKDPCPQGVLQ